MQTITVLFIFCSLAITITLAQTHYQTNNEADSKKTPLFIKSLKKLHKEPPSPVLKARAAIETKTIEQKLDHFDENTKATWDMRYMVNDEHFEKGGPMFIMLGGEWEISSGLISGGHFYDMAKEHKAILYYTEHRYYGQSKPTKDITLENLKYLHVKQALADVAHFIRYMRRTVPALANSKVIMAGGSYAASMVVWFKRLYPELLAGGWASSAPLLAKVDFREYKEVTGRTLLELGGQKCYDRVKNGIAELESMFEQKRGAEVKAMMKLCNNFDENNDLDLWTLFSTISNLFSAQVQNQSDDDIPSICNFLKKFEDDATAIASFLLLFVSSGCVNVAYSSTVRSYADSTYDPDSDRTWFYQTCNEYGWFHSSSSANQPFGTKFPVTLYTTLCQDVFGEKYTNEQINLFAKQTNKDFGGLKPMVENIFSTHGSLDPWSALGHGKKEGATILPNTSHCKDFDSIDSADSKEMRAAKENVAQLVREWLA